MRRRRPRARIAQSILSILLALGPSVATLLACGPEAPPAPRDGLRSWERHAWVPVPGGLVNAAGGALVVARPLLSIDTRLGPLAIAGVHQPVAGSWRWSFEAELRDGVFTDATGARYDVSGLAAGEVVPGTEWVKLDPSTLKTRGGLVHAFDTAGRLAFVHWSSDAYPRLEYRTGPVGAEVRIVAIEQCTAPATCEPVYDLSWSVEGRLVAVDDRAGRRAELDWDAAGHLVAARDAGDVEAGLPGDRYAWAGDRLVGLVTSDGETVTYAYAGARLASVALGSLVHAFSYDRAGGLNRTIYVSPGGTARVIEWDGQRRVVRRILVGADEIETFTWEGLRVARREAPDGTAAEWTWVDGWLAAERPPGQDERLYLWNPDGVNRLDPTAGAPLEVRDALGVLLSVAYDAAGRPEVLTDGAGDATRLVWDGLELVSRESPSGALVTFEGYGEHGWPTRILAAGEIVDQPVYDAVGNRVQVRDFSDPTSSATPGVVERAFDADRRVASLVVVDDGPGYPTPPWEETLVIERRGDGQPLRVLRPYGGDTEYGYDARGLLVERREKVDGVFHATVFEYDAEGRRSAEEKPNGMRREWSYDAAGRVEATTALRFGVVESVLTSTWQAGRRVATHDSVRDADEVYLYDAAGRVERVVHAGGEATVLAYDGRGRPTTVTLELASGQVLRALGVDYDGASREVAVRDGGPGGPALLERVFQDGRLTETRYGNGLVRGYAYGEGTDRWVGAVTTAADGSWVAETALAAIPNGGGAMSYIGVRTADSFGTPNPPMESPPGEIKTGEYYDVSANTAAPRLHGWRMRTAHQGYVWEWNDARYDALGNRTYSRQSLPEKEMEFRYFEHHYNAEHNRLLSIEETFLEGGSEIARSYAYDEAGYAIEVDGTPVAWNAQGRVASIGGVASFVWDAAGRPVSRNVMGEETVYWFGGLLEAAPGELPATLDLGEVRLDLAGDDHRYRHYDPRGNVSFVTDPSGAVVAHHWYEGYGRLTSFGPDADARGFAGGTHAAGFVVLGPRILDPLAGRFLSPDPVEQLLDPYTYAWGNPVQFWDPGGLQAQPTPQGPPVTATIVEISGLLVMGIGIAVTPIVGPAIGGTLALLGAALQAVAIGIRDDAARKDAAVLSSTSAPLDLPPVPAAGLETQETCIDGFCFARPRSDPPREPNPGGGRGGGAFNFGFPDLSASCGAAPGSCASGTGLVLALPWLLGRRTRIRREH